ncbi:acylphosphatase-1-like isoform X1 [Cylas formicarius]|uniref:acylphosphatase-1-like n=1 Tax=Cylas formicarius TaxID=197179 RepID=UPI0029589E13|nr:acylphosphatase-1-like [Cylas formicarius]XP_060536523.1 acylphosphatase-1-like isoform X1 [Cylas formicarius]
MVNSKFCLLFVFLGLKLSENEKVSDMNSDDKLFSVKFEIYGRVQGVFFRKYTQSEATKLGVKGWCRNTDRDTVEGTLEGSKKRLNAMKHWLQTKGSPKSRIDRAVFQDEHEIEGFTFDGFTVKH